MKEPIDHNELDKLIDKCWEHHKDMKLMFRSVFPDRDIPILWFGNIHAYEKSEHRIVSVGLNPSEMEFREGKSLKRKGEWSMWRFRKASEIAVRGGLMSKSDVQNYKDALNQYFNGYSTTKATAYKKWFSNWKCILHGLRASFDPKEADNTAIHTDFCTPLATTDGWGDLAPAIKQKLCADATGKKLWRNLLMILKPDLVLTCNKEEIVEQMVEALGFDKDHCYVLEEEKKFCPLLTSHPVIHSWGAVSGYETHLLAAPVSGSPWKGWYKCQTEAFAKEISNTLCTIEESSRLDVVMEPSSMKMMLKTSVAK